MKPRALILFAPGTNRDRDAAVALEQAGAEAVVLPLKQLRVEQTDWNAFQMLVIPGGFSYADALGAGKLFAFDLQHYFDEQLQSFVAAGKPVIGICNGFQTLVKCGILPEPRPAGVAPRATLTFNRSNHFECRWVSLQPRSQACIWTAGLTRVIDCPVAHGEGNFQVGEPAYARALFDSDQVALIYAHPDGRPSEGQYPLNPNGSVLDIAGVCNPAGNVLGLMPHPEDNVFPFQAPDRANGPNHLGLPLFENGVRYAAGL